MELQPDHAQLYNNLGTAYLTKGDIDRAYQNFTRASELEPDNALTYFNIASILQIQNKHKEACQFFDKAYSIDNNDTYLTAMALSEVKIGDWENAIKHYKILVTHYPEKQTYQYNLACCYEQIQEYKYAIGILVKLVALNPKSVNISQRLAGIFMKTNQPRMAKEIYEKILKLGKVSYDVYYEYAHVCLILKEDELAESILKKVVTLKPDYANAHKDLGVLYLSKRLFDYAKDEFEQAVSIAPENSKILCEYANYLHATSEFKKADEYYQKSLKLTPHMYKAYALSALNKMFLKEYDIAIEQINEAIAHSVQNGFYLYLAGKLHFLKGEFEDAKRYLIKAFEIDRNLDTQNLLGMCYFELKDFEQAKNIFLSLLKLNEYNINVLFQLAKCEKALNNTDKALEYLERTVEISPEYEEAQEMIREIS